MHECATNCDIAPGKVWDGCMSLRKACVRTTNPRLRTVIHASLLLQPHNRVSPIVLFLMLNIMALLSWAQFEEHVLE